MRELHSADLPIPTTEPITSHNECLQVVKSFAKAKHLTEWSDIPWKDSHTPGKTTKVETLSTVHLYIATSDDISHYSGS